MWPSARTVLLLIASNVFMTAAFRLREIPRWNEAVAFALIMAAVVVSNI